MRPKAETNAKSKENMRKLFPASNLNHSFEKECKKIIWGMGKEDKGSGGQGEWGIGGQGDGGTRGQGGGGSGGQGDNGNGRQRRVSTFCPLFSLSPTPLVPLSPTPLAPLSPCLLVPTPRYRPLAIFASF